MGSTLSVVEMMSDLKREMYRFSVESRLDREDIIMGQGPAPPNPFMVERFQSVVSSLFQQVRSRRLRLAENMPASAAPSSEATDHPTRLC